MPTRTLKRVSAKLLLRRRFMLLERQHQCTGRVQYSEQLQRVTGLMHTADIAVSVQLLVSIHLYTATLRVSVGVYLRHEMLFCAAICGMHCIRDTTHCVSKTITTAAYE
eukprot:17820-Heterococcus_DN1.PRE.2